MDRGSFHQHSISEAYMFAGDRRDALARNHNAGKVQRISGGDGNGFSAKRKIFHGPQRFYGNGQRKLLADKRVDEASAANLTSIFQPSKGDQQLAPAGNHAFSRQ